MRNVFRTEFVEKIAFLERPDYATRQALKKAGFKYNGAMWTRTRGTTSTVNDEQLLMLIEPEKVFEPVE